MKGGVELHNIIYKDLVSELTAQEKQQILLLPWLTHSSLLNFTSQHKVIEGTFLSKCRNI